MQKFVTEELIFMTVAGSRMYGTDTPESDVDKRGVCVPPKNVMLGFARGFEQQEYPGEDTTVFSLQKFMKLAADCNPNIIELLYAPEECIETIHPTWKRLMKHRSEFLSAKCKNTFTGYALGQLKRIRTHRAWLLTPPTHKPTRQEYGLGASGSGVRELAKGVDVAVVDPSVARLLEAEKRYKNALTTWNQYENWKKERNKARSKLEAAHGYDTKHAMHLVRLLRMGKEILATGHLTVRRPDAHELLAIRHGSKTYDELMEDVAALQAEIDQIYTSKSYAVPYSVDREKLSDLCAELHDFHWNQKSSR